MTDDFISYGTPQRFQLGLKWLEQDEPLARRPRDHGWSLGALVLTVAGENLTARRLGGDAQDRLIWYFGPLLHWLADNWVALLHEEHFPWPERSEDGAAAVCNQAIARFAAVGPATAGPLEAAQAWYRRHGLASAASGGLFPDIFLRRFADDVELSWTAAPPPFAPDGFTFETEPGLARLAIADVAEPLWQMLTWVRDNPPNLETPAFRADWEALAKKTDALQHIVPERFNVADVADALLARVRASFKAKGRDDLQSPELAAGARFAIAQAPAVAMFGGLSVALSDADITILRDTLIAAANGTMPEHLLDIVENAPLLGKPWQDGYDLAEDLLERLGEMGFHIASNSFFDVRALCQQLKIEVSHKGLDTDTIRGVALAGIGFTPSILVNTRSTYNRNDEGQRFAIAHELCHILHDQSRAQRLAHTSGPWAAPGVEKCANAFAAWLLMPPRLLERHIDTGRPIDDVRLQKMAMELRVTGRALVEHLFNLSLIDEVERDERRLSLRH